MTGGGVKVVLDCDPGHDDALAILLAGRHCDLLGVTTVSGNAPLEYTTQNALLMCQLAGLDVPVHSGADRPLREPAEHAPRVHGQTGLDGPERPEVTRKPASDDAVAFIIETVRAHEGVWLVPVGPLTNIAMAITQAPDIIGRLAGISLMGGSAGAGNVTATAEFNLWADPHAAEIVFSSGVSLLRMVGLNLTHQFMVDDGVVAEIKAHDRTVAQFVAGLYDFSLDAHEHSTGERASPLHDPCAVLNVIRPDLLRREARHVTVSTEGPLTRGMTIVDERPRTPEAPNCEVAYDIDADAGMRLVIDAVCSYK